RRDRTADLYNAIVALSQLSYGPTCVTGAYVIGFAPERQANFFNFLAVPRRRLILVLLPRIPSQRAWFPSWKNPPVNPAHGATAHASYPAPESPWSPLRTRSSAYPQSPRTGAA